MKKIFILCLLALASLAPTTFFAQPTAADFSTTDPEFARLQLRIHTCLDPALSGSATVSIVDDGPTGYLVWSPDSIYISWVIEVGLVEQSAVWHTRTLYRSGTTSMRVVEGGIPISIPTQKGDQAGGAVLRGNGNDKDMVVGRLSETLGATGCRFVPQEK